MDVDALISFLHVLERLKCNTRHSWTSTGRHETVAAHSWRLATLALLLRDAFPELDMDRVTEMCLVHDFGEAVTGDIPSFEKSEGDERAEADAVAAMLEGLPAAPRGYVGSLFEEMNAMRTCEARLYKALDKLEAVLQHNEAPIDTWLPLEYDLQQTYGVDEAEAFPPVAALRARLLEDTRAKIDAGRDA